jgi:hypothetical protein
VANHRHRLAVVLSSLVAVTLATLVGAGAALARFHTGYYSGTTSEGKRITFALTGSQISEILTETRNTCRHGSRNLFLDPKGTAKFPAGGHYRLSGPSAKFKLKVSGSRATGTLSTRIGKCSAHVKFKAKPSDPLKIDSASIGDYGTDVTISAGFPAGSNGNEAIPYTGLGLLVYGSNTGCPATYAAADSQARNVSSDGFYGFISDAYVDADYEVQPYQLAYFAYTHGHFVWHVATTTIVDNDPPQDPFTTVCAMLYAGVPATGGTPLENVSHPLPLGPGIPNNQPK